MRHITEEYGMVCNLLELTLEEYKQLEPFLLALGIRTRQTSTSFNGNAPATTIIQGENPFEYNAQYYSKDLAYKYGKEALTEFNISCYKR